MANVTFLGACGVVTGSSTLLTWSERSVLVDCGLYQGSEELEQRNWSAFPFQPRHLAAVLVTHAHLDHTGLLPRLTAEGFSGPIFCTKPSRALISLVLQDAAQLQEEEHRYALRKVYSRHPVPRPLYTGEDARRALKLLHPVAFDVERDLEPPREAPDALLLESTYGDRLHARDDAAEALDTIITETFARGGMVIIPAFALGRTQEVLYHLSALADRGRLDPRTVFLDSPMAIAPSRFARCRTAEQSKLLNSRREPAVIVASSGMASGGRVVHHLLHHLSDPRSSVVLTGYQAAGTNGRALVECAETVAIHGQAVRVRAAIHQLNSLSAHADREELLRWCRALPGVPRRIFLNHGEDAARKALSVEIAAEAGWPRPVLPLPGESVPW
ncbi:MAG TPA: MBL fold metallo-hydrolase [Thermoanaerobaculia bacterium]|jgi:metallo-beta-lactamase family protein|nr:MBL fold metallo-hydrolase [Thermoanaerobaculia bacterium]